MMMVITLTALGEQKRIELSKDVELYSLALGIWRQVTCQAVKEWSNVTVNGLIVVDGVKAALIDTPWPPEADDHAARLGGEEPQCQDESGHRRSFPRRLPGQTA